MAAAIGVGTLNDSYQVANVLPTMIYVLVGGGALNAVFVPQLVRAMKKDDDGGEAYANRLLTLVMVALAAVTVLCVAAAPLLVHAMSPEIADDPRRLRPSPLPSPATACPPCSSWAPMSSSGRSSTRGDVSAR